MNLIANGDFESGGEWTPSPPADALTLRRAAVIVHRRSKKPDGVACRTIVQVLRNLADKIEAEA